MWYLQITIKCKYINQNESQASIEDIKIYYIKIIE